MGSVLEGLGLLRGGGEGSPVLVLVLVLDGGVSPSSLLSQVQAARGAPGTGGRRHRLGEEISEGFKLYQSAHLVLLQLDDEDCDGNEEECKEDKEEAKNHKILVSPTVLLPSNLFDDDLVLAVRYIPLIFIF